MMTRPPHDALIEEIVRLVRYNIDALGIAPHQICILAPWWIHLLSMTRKLIALLPEYPFDGPGMVPFSRNLDNFWYRLARLALLGPSPEMYVRRRRWAHDLISTLRDWGVDVGEHSSSGILKIVNDIVINEDDGLKYLELFFVEFASKLGFLISDHLDLQNDFKAFFESSQARLARLEKDGVVYMGTISAFRRALQERTGITVSTVHGVKGAEFDTVIAYGLLEDIVPHFNDPDGQDSARKLLYVACSRARKNLHLISEQGRVRFKDFLYYPTNVLAAREFQYDSVP